MALNIVVSPRSHASTIDELNFKKNIKEKILKGEIFSETIVKNSSTSQSLDFKIAGLHQKSCDYVLKKLSLYEHYSTFLDFVKESKYNEKKEEINFLLSHRFLPFDMRLIFNLPRITKEGTYPFGFDIGFLSGLKGKIHVNKEQNQCFFYSTAYWTGNDTKIPNKILEFFTQSLSIHAMKTLFRISNTLSH